MLVLLALTLAPAFTPAAAQSPDLFTLARFNRIMRLTDFDCLEPELETLFTYVNPTFFLPRGLELHRDGEFFAIQSGEDLTTGETTFIPGTAPETSNVCGMRFGIGFDAEAIHPVYDGSPNSTGQAATLVAPGKSRRVLAREWALAPRLVRQQHPPCHPR
ncbi:MAG: hypothetical protein AAGG01_00015 [Planctomycetota bacterium]